MGSGSFVWTKGFVFTGVAWTWDDCGAIGGGCGNCGGETGGSGAGVEVDWILENFEKRRSSLL